MGGPDGPKPAFGPRASETQGPRLDPFRFMLDRKCARYGY